MALIIHNETANNKNYAGQILPGNSTYQIPDSELAAFRVNDKLISDLTLTIPEASLEDTADAGVTITGSDAIAMLLLDLPKLVTTKRETDKIVLKMASAKKASNSSGLCKIQMKIPGTNNPTGDTTLDGRFIESGFAFFEGLNIGDCFTVRIIDVDDISGNGAGIEVGSYTEDYSAEVGNAENDGKEGWCSDNSGGVGVRALGYFGFIGSGYYMVIEGQNLSGTQEDMYVNVKWGKGYQ